MREKKNVFVVVEKNKRNAEKQMVGVFFFKEKRKSFLDKLLWEMKTKNISQRFNLVKPPSVHKQAFCTQARTQSGRPQNRGYLGKNTETGRRGRERASERLVGRVDGGFPRPPLGRLIFLVSGGESVTTFAAIS